MFPPEIWDQICSELYTQLWIHTEPGKAQYQPTTAFDIRGRRPIGNWVPAWRALKILRQVNKALNASASRVYFRRLEVASWTESQSPMLKLWEIAQSPYAIHVEELRIIQWPNAEQGDHDTPLLDPSFRSISEWSRETLRMCCERFIRLRELGMDDTGFFSAGEKDENPALLLYTPFWRRVLAACPPTLRTLHYTAPTQDKWSFEEDSSAHQSWDSEEPNNRWSSTQLIALHLTFGQYFTPHWWRPRFPAPIGINGLEELEMNYMGPLATLAMPMKFIELMTLKTFKVGLPMGDAHSVACRGWDLRLLLSNNRHSLETLSIESLKLSWVKEDCKTWADVFIVLADSTIIRDVNIRGLFKEFVHADGGRTTGLVYNGPNDIHPDCHEEVDAIKALIERAEKNRSRNQAGGD